MGAQWFQIDATTGNIEGWGRTSSDEMPTAPEGKILVAAADDALAQYEALRADMTNDGRADAPRYVDGVVTAPPDERLRLRIEVDRNEAMVSEIVAFTVTAIDREGNRRWDFHERVSYSMPDGRILAFGFVSGVTLRGVVMPKSGRYLLCSNNEVALDTPIEILVLE